MPGEIREHVVRFGNSRNYSGFPSERIASETMVPLTSKVSQISGSQANQ